MTLSEASSRVSTTTRRRSRRLQTGAAPRWLSILALVSWVVCGWPGVQDVYAQTGDFIVVREATAGDTITTEDSFATLDWDTTVKDEGAGRPTLSGGNQILLDAGHHLVLYSIKATQPGAFDRASWASRLQLAGSTLAYGYGGGYTRNSTGLLTGISFGGALINVALAGDALTLQWARQDTSGSNVTRDANASGLQVLKLDDTLDYLRIREVGGGQDFDTTTFTSINWDTADETDTASFGFTAASTNITLKGASGKLFLVFANMGMNIGTLRTNVEMAFFLDGTELSGSRVTAYGRGSSKPGAIDESWLSGAFLIAKTSASDQTLTVRARREDTNTQAITNKGGETALTIMALPDAAEAIRLTNTTAENLNAVGPEVFNWDTEDEEDAAAFTHDTVTNNSRITVDVADDYLFFVQAYEGSTTGATRVRPWLRFRKNGGSDLTYAMASRLGRNIEGSANAGMWAGNIFEDLVANDYVEATHTRGSDATDTYNSDQLYFWGLRIGSLVGGPAAALTDTLADGATEAQIVAGGEKLVITLTLDTWDATIGADNSKTTDLINGIDSAQSEAAGWDAVVKANLDYNDVVRTSDTVVTITLGTEATYLISATETITVTVPATAVAGTDALVATPTFAVTPPSSSPVTTYSFQGVTTANHGDGTNPIAIEHDSDVFPWTTAADQNDSANPTDAEYVNISADNTSQWATDDPADLDEMAITYRFYLQETVSKITNIEITWNGNTDGAAANHSIWLRKDGFDEFGGTNTWVQLGSSLSIPADVDTDLVRSLTSDFSTYVNAGTGQLEFVVT